MKKLSLTVITFLLLLTLINVSAFAAELAGRAGQ